MQESRAELAKFIELAGVETGVKWFIEGISLSQAKDRQIKILTAESAWHDQQLAAVRGSLPRMPDHAFRAGSRNLGTAAAAIERSNPHVCGK